MRLYPRRKKNGTKVWWASWTEDSVTVRRSTRCATQEAAWDVVRRWERERADPELAASRQATLGVEALTFLRECRSADLSAGTVAMYEQKLANVCDIIGRETPLADVSADRVGRYFDTRRGEGAAESTLYKEWVALRGVLVSARHRGRYARDPAAVKPPRLTPKYTPRETWLTWQQADALLDELEGDHRRAVAFVLATGVRRGEWWRASSGDIDRKRGVLIVRGTKTDASAATIPIPAPMLRWLRIAGEPPFARWSNDRRGLERACRRAGVPRVTWNDLRRTFASLLVQAGAAPHVVAKLLRHKSTAMVDRVYGRVSPEALGDLLRTQLQTARGPSVNQRSSTKRHKRTSRGR